LITDDSRDDPKSQGLSQSFYVTGQATEEMNIRSTYMIKKEKKKRPHR
jgi:hypothetical protein